LSAVGSEKNLLTPTSIYTASGIVNADLLRVRRLGLVGCLEKNKEYTVRVTGHKTPGESSVNITVSVYDTTHLQENPQRIE